MSGTNSCALSALNQPWISRLSSFEHETMRKGFPVVHLEADCERIRGTGVCLWDCFITSTS